jgi:hypothetical protein
MRRLILAAVVFLAACREPSPTAPATRLGVAVPAPLPSGPEYSWSQGQNAVYMGTAIGRVCFLTMVSGKFDGPNEWVRVTNPLGKWYLSGGSSTSGVAAKARCLEVASYTAEVTIDTTWSGTPIHVVSKTLTGDACALTGVGGRFELWPEAVRVKKLAGDPWTLTVALETGGHIIGRARCILDPSHSATYTHQWFDPDPPEIVASSSTSTCFLAGMGGPFRDVTHWVRVFRGTSSWYLLGASHDDLRASSLCVPS